MLFEAVLAKGIRVSINVRLVRDMADTDNTMVVTTEIIMVTINVFKMIFRRIPFKFINPPLYCYKINL